MSIENSLEIALEVMWEFWADPIDRVAFQVHRMCPVENVVHFYLFLQAADVFSGILTVLSDSSVLEQHFRADNLKSVCDRLLSSPAHMKSRFTFLKTLTIRFA